MLEGERIVLGFFEQLAYPFRQGGVGLELKKCKKWGLPSDLAKATGSSKSYGVRSYGVTEATGSESYGVTESYGVRKLRGQVLTPRSPAN